MDLAARRRTEFAALARNHERDLMRTSYRLCRSDRDRAADLVQDTLVRAYEAYLKGQFSAWDKRPALVAAHPD